MPNSYIFLFIFELNLFTIGKNCEGIKVIFNAKNKTQEHLKSLLRCTWHTCMLCHSRYGFSCIFETKKFTRNKKKSIFRCYVDYHNALPPWGLGTRSGLFNIKFCMFQIKILTSRKHITCYVAEKKFTHSNPIGHFEVSIDWSPGN